MSTATPVESNAAQSSQDWQQLASRVLSEDHKVTRDEALAILRSSDDEILDLMSAAFRLRQKYFGKTVQLYFLMNQL